MTEGEGEERTVHEPEIDVRHAELLERVVERLLDLVVIIVVQLRESEASISNLFSEFPIRRGLTFVVRKNDSRATPDAAMPIPTSFSLSYAVYISRRSKRKSAP